MEEAQGSHSHTCRIIQGCGVNTISILAFDPWNQIESLMCPTPAEQRRTTRSNEQPSHGEFKHQRRRPFARGEGRRQMGKEGRRERYARRGEQICKPVGEHELQITAGEKNLKISASALICITAAASAPNKGGCQNKREQE